MKSISVIDGSREHHFGKDVNLNAAPSRLNGRSVQLYQEMSARIAGEGEEFLQHPRPSLWHLWVMKVKNRTQTLFQGCFHAENRGNRNLSLQFERAHTSPRLSSSESDESISDDEKESLDEIDSQRSLFTEFQTNHSPVSGEGIKAVTCYDSRKELISGDIFDGLHDQHPLSLKDRMRTLWKATKGWISHRRNQNFRKPQTDLEKGSLTSHRAPHFVKGSLPKGLDFWRLVHQQNITKDRWQCVKAFKGYCHGVSQVLVEQSLNGNEVKTGILNTQAFRRRATDFVIYEILRCKILCYLALIDLEPLIPAEEFKLFDKEAQKMIREIQALKTQEALPFKQELLKQELIHLNQQLPPIADVKRYATFGEAARVFEKEGVYHLKFWRIVEGGELPAAHTLYIRTGKQNVFYNLRRGCGLCTAETKEALLAILSEHVQVTYAKNLNSQGVWEVVRYQEVISS